MYFKSSSNVGASDIQTVGCLAAATSTVILVSWRLFGENPLVTTVSPVTKIAHSAGGTIFSPDGTEKSNSRSPASSSSYNTTGLSATLKSLMETGLPDYSHASFIFSGRYPPKIFNSDGFHLASAYVSPSSMSSSFLESEEFHKRRLSRRTIKSGYWPQLGNEIHLHSKTGTGAFSQICPHFDNDIIWTDRFSWDVVSRNELLNVNLFPPPAPPVSVASERMLLGVGT